MAKLGGALIGYGIKKRNGEEKKVIFDKPIHNTITKSCLNNLLTFNGTNAQPSTNLPGNHLSLFFKSSQASERYGVFNSAALGDGTGETSVNDTDLKHRVSAQTSTKKTGVGWCQTYSIYNDAVIKLRVSHIHTIEQNFTIKEIGWYNATYPDLNYTLSARVQLEEFIDVEAGDEFYSIYELTVSFQGVEKFNDFAGLGVGGYKTNAVCCNKLSGSVDNEYSTIIPTIKYDGTPYQSGVLSGSDYYMRPIMRQPYMIDASLSYMGEQCIYSFSSNWNKLKPFVNLINSFAGENISRINNVVKDYIQDSFYRDVEFVTSVLNGTFYGFVVNGTFYRFGTFDEQDNFTPTPININSALKITCRQRWSTDLLTPAG